MNYKIDIKRIIDEQIHIQGWVLPTDVNEKVLYEVYDSKGNNINYKFVAMKRQDVEGIYLKKEIDGLMLGFDILFPYTENENYKLIIKTKDGVAEEKLSKDIIDRFNSYSFKKKELFLN